MFCAFEADKPLFLPDAFRIQVKMECVVSVPYLDHEALHLLNLPHIGMFPPLMRNSGLETMHADGSSMATTGRGRDRSKENDEQRAPNNSVHPLRDGFGLEAFDMTPDAQICSKHFCACFEVFPALDNTQTTRDMSLNVPGETKYLDRRH